MDIASILKSIGYIGIFLSVFIECGVPLGLVLPLPGFSLLFTAGIFAATGPMNVYAVIFTGVLAAILGYIVGYGTGRKYGHRLFSAKNETYFTAAQGKKAKRFIKTHGSSTLILSRFLPFMHSIAPILSGYARTSFGGFMINNIIGGILWVLSAVLLGFFLGHTIPNAQHYAIPIVLGIIILSNLPVFRNRLQKAIDKIEE